MKQYEKMMPNENLSWCRPMVSRDGRVTLAVNEGAIVGLMLDGKELQISEEEIARVARIVNESYDNYSGWNNTHILLDGDLTELGCSSCPWRDVCDAMDEE